LFFLEVITESLKAGKEKKTKDKKAVENGTEKIEDVANDVDAAGKKEGEKPKGDPPVIEGKLEDLVR